jgi:hypothetical protein
MRVVRVVTKHVPPTFSFTHVSLRAADTLAHDGHMAVTELVLRIDASNDTAGTVPCG